MAKRKKGGKAKKAAKPTRKAKASQKRKAGHRKASSGTTTTSRRVSYKKPSGRPATKKETAMMMDWWEIP